MIRSNKTKWDTRTAQHWTLTKRKVVIKLTQPYKEISSTAWTFLKFPNMYVDSSWSLFLPGTSAKVELITMQLRTKATKRPQGGSGGLVRLVIFKRQRRLITVVAWDSPEQGNHKISQKHDKCQAVPFSITHPDMSSDLFLPNNIIKIRRRS